ncbi:hypothetical protein MIMGU_mgv1a022917mg [Erythranthe guttata]|uniref:Transcription factor CBF/NF-Y/archaeal histone domain-containing protein n=1 Tax=Erythranthe guttata TaxID=4155 RepID=A0A022RYL0_ERYGU|nr:hypothetical protein MIMGU_mgv1a022917mg [Erythranthe guttata]
MPMTNIVRILCRTLPPHAKISDMRRRLFTKDVIASMASLGFDDYVELLKFFLNKYRAEDHERSASIGTQQPPAAPVAPPVPAPPPATLVVMGDGAVIVDDEEEVDPDEYIGFDEVIRMYFLNDYGDGDAEGSPSSGGD